jgi:hypothetical protein
MKSPSIQSPYLKLPGKYVKESGLDVKVAYILQFLF